MDISYMKVNVVQTVKIETKENKNQNIMIKIKDIPNAEANGIKWLIASGVKTDEEALKLVDRFIENIKELK